MSHHNHHITITATIKYPWAEWYPHTKIENVSSSLGPLSLSKRSSSNIRSTRLLLLLLSFTCEYKIEGKWEFGMRLCDREICMFTINVSWVNALVVYVKKLKQYLYFFYCPFSIIIKSRKWNGDNAMTTEEELYLLFVMMTVL